jgi:molecular chaperone GrpE
VRAYVARALSKRGRSRSDELQGASEPTADGAETGPDPATTDGVQQPKRLERQVDDDQVDNDTSRAREPENLNKGQAAADSKPGARTDASGPKGSGGKARAESTTDEGERGAAEAAQGDAGEDAGDAKDAKAASNGDARTKVVEADGAQKTTTEDDEKAEGQPATPADAAAGAGEAADAPTDQRADEDDEPEAAEATDDAAVEAEAEAPAAAADADEAADGETAEADEATDDEATDDEATDDEVIEAELVEDEEEDAEAEQPAAVVEEEPSEAVLAELVAARAEADGYLDDLRRLQAEFDNYRKRTMREQTARIASASQALVSRLLPVLDNFELAVSHAEQSRDFDRMLKGVEMVFGELNEVLGGEGLVAIEASGKPFDPERHEAVVAVEEDGVEAGTVVDVIRKGYEFNGRVLRPAMVKVAR